MYKHSICACVNDDKQFHSQFGKVTYIKSLFEYYKKSETYRSYTYLIFNSFIEVDI